MLKYEGGALTNWVSDLVKEVPKRSLLPPCKGTERKLAITVNLLAP